MLNTTTSYEFIYFSAISCNRLVIYSASVCERGLQKSMQVSSIFNTTFNYEAWPSSYLLAMTLISSVIICLNFPIWICSFMSSILSLARYWFRLLDLDELLISLLLLAQVNWCRERSLFGTMDRQLGQSTTSIINNKWL